MAGRRGPRPLGAPTEAILLRSVEFGEADRVVTFFTAEHGLAGFLARGARRPGKRYGAALEAFQLVELTVRFGTGELGQLQEARVLRAFPRILGRLSALEVGGRVFERTRRLFAARQREPEVFAVLVTLLEALEQSTEPTLDHHHGLLAEAHLLALAGVTPRLAACQIGGEPAPSGRAALFHPARNGIVCTRCGGGPIYMHGATRSYLEAAFAGAATELTPLDEEGRAEARRVLDAVLETALR